MIFQILFTTPNQIISTFAELYKLIFTECRDHLIYFIAYLKPENLISGLLVLFLFSGNISHYLSFLVNDFFIKFLSLWHLSYLRLFAVIISRGGSINERIAHFSSGAANGNIIQMIWIFILAEHLLNPLNRWERSMRP